VPALACNAPATPSGLVSHRTIERQDRWWALHNAIARFKRSPGT
jgi:hypothetical protein